MSSLLVLPSLPVWVVSPGRYGLTRKFISGMQQYVDRWPGQVKAVMRTIERPTNDLDQVIVTAEELPFRLSTPELHSQQFKDELAAADIVLSGTDHQLNHVAAWCREVDTPVVICTEYTLATRCQIIQAETANPLRRWRRMYWDWNQERANRRSIALATGVQCNGTPTYDAYHRLNEQTMLYFDTRSTAASIFADESLAQRLTSLRRHEPLRLAFSGRLAAMKGADHLTRVAQELKRLGLDFQFTIFGDGPLRERLQADIERDGLHDCVTLAGNVDFKQELMPRLRSETDLFVCPHRQGDPSCTYLETMSCGVPIVGYANEAWTGLLPRSQAGWSTPLNSPQLLAKRIVQLNADREAIVGASRRALHFARKHTFEATFQSRIEHLQSCAGISHVESEAYVASEA